MSAAGQKRDESGVNSDDETIYFHVVAHSHDDVGWLSTPDEYFEERVNHILTSVVQALSADPKRKFSQAEIFYFERWWNIQDDATQTKVRRLIAQG